MSNLTEDKKVFIDFGSGPNIDSLQKYKNKGYFTISVNKDKGELFLNSGYNKDMHYFFEQTDEFFFFDISDLNNKCDNYKADAWHCGAVMEHVEPEKIDGFLQNILNHSKEEFEGSINIDLTDHKGGFLHYKNPEYFTYIKNTLKRNEWYEKIKKFFRIIGYNEGFKFEDDQNRPTTLFFRLKRKRV
jgi:hypothetical protein|tara:strand:+ start:2805 stop:3365 length:561 start_codon:yes stop_codon:yes gene_type:complete